MEGQIVYFRFVGFKHTVALEREMMLNLAFSFLITWSSHKSAPQPEVTLDKKDGDLQRLKFALLGLLQVFFLFQLLLKIDLARLHPYLEVK